MAYKNVAIIGGSGALGAPVLKGLVESGKFNITAITRPESKSTFPSSVKVVKADYTSVDDLSKAFQGQDVIISAVGNEGFAGQTVFIDAAIAAGVKRFIPSEFGSNLENPLVAALPVFADKVTVRKHLESKVAAHPTLTYTYVINSAFFEWGLEHSFIFNWKSGKPEIYDGGDVPFTTATFPDIARAVLSVLAHPEETKNRQVIVTSIVTTQNKLLALARRAAPEKAAAWELTHLKITDVEKANAESVSKGDFSFPVIFDQLKLSVFGGARYGQPLKDDNELLGVKHLTDEEVVEIWKKVLA